MVDFSVLAIDRAVRHLHQLAGEGGSVHGIQVAVLQMEDHVPLEPLIQLLFLGIHLNLDPAGDQLRHIQVVGGFHRDADVGDQLVDLLLRALLGLVAVDDLPIALVRQEEPLPVSTYEPAQPLAHVQKVHLGPQVEEAVGLRGPGQADDPADTGPHPFQSPEPLRLAALEGGQLVNDQCVEIPAVVVNQPGDILPVDDVNLRPAL